MIDTTEELQAREALRDTMEKTTCLLRAIEYAILSTNSGDDRMVYKEIYDEVVKCRKHLRLAEQILDESVACWIHYLGLPITVEE